MSHHARDAIYWTRDRLGPREREFLASLPLAVAEEDRLYVHASADQPEAWTYITGAKEAAASFAATAARVTFSGHVHHPLVYFTTAGATPRAFLPVAGVPIPLSDYRRWLIIVGSVGQPRDDNPAACYAMHDSVSGAFTHFRVPYDAHAAAQKIRAAGLPERLAWRLTVGQ